MKNIIALTLIVGLFMPLMMTGAQEKKSQEESFKSFDKNGDGKVSKEEFLASTKEERKGKRGMNFDKADKNKDGFLTLEEWKEAYGS